MISEESSCDTHVSNSDLHYSNKLYFKVGYIKIQNHFFFLIVKIFPNITVFFCIFEKINSGFLKI